MALQIFENGYMSETAGEPVENLFKMVENGGNLLKIVKNGEC